jgi:hypothetical protein
MSKRFPVDIWRKLTGSQLRLCEELTFLAGERWAYVSRNYLSRKLGLTVNHISHVTSQLVQLGVVEKQQRKFRRSDGTWDTRPCLYRVVGWLVWKLKGLFARVFKRKPSGLRSSVGRPIHEEKLSVSDFSHIKNEGRRSLLERFAALGGRSSTSRAIESKD